MSIVMFLGRDVNDYREICENIIAQKIKDGDIRCEHCTNAMKVHSNYTRTIKETGEKIVITMVWCRKCKNWHALTPDFLLPRKHYSGNEIEGVIIESTTLDGEAVQVSKIYTDACESTVWRWIRQTGERIKGAISVLKGIFSEKGWAVSEINIDAKTDYGELEQVLLMAQADAKHSGNKLGLANIWLGCTAEKCAYSANL